MIHDVTTMRARRDRALQREAVVALFHPHDECFITAVVECRSHGIDVVRAVHRGHACVVRTSSTRLSCRRPITRCRARNTQALHNTRAKWWI